MSLDVELAEVRDFLAEHHPFDDLPRQQLERLATMLKIEYFRRGTRIIARGEENHHLYIVRSGAVELHDMHGGFMDRGEVGTSFGSYTLVQGNPANFEAVALEDTLCLVMDADTFHALSTTYPIFGHYFDLQRTSRMRGAVASLHLTNSGSAILKTNATDIINRPAVSVQATESIRAAALVMSHKRVSCLLILDEAKLVGIVTDRDLRNRVVASGIDTDLPVTCVMTPDPFTGSADALAFQILMEMTSRNIHHLPILTPEGRPEGVITTTDLMRLEQTNPIYLVGDITQAEDVSGVAEVSKRLSAIVELLVTQDASAEDIGRIVTAVGDAVERRVLGLAEAHLGPAPVPYCWVSLGSRARQEQALAADQDNALILDNEVLPEHAAYFEALATFVCDALVECGYPRCPGDIMATNPRWRVPLNQWRAEFTTWLTEPVPDAILRASIFFDMRPIYGDPRLFHKLRKHFLKQAPSAKLFLAHLTKRAVENEPPLGFFRGFVLEKHGANRATLDIKRGGVGAVVELARVLALSIGSRAVNTQTRLAAAVDAGVLSPERGQDLRDAFEFISYVRLRHQAAQVRAGKDTDNFVAPDDLSSFEKRHLREAFAIVRSAQSSLSHRYPSTYIS
jgi:CBS domain-containing protein